MTINIFCFLGQYGTKQSEYFKELLRDIDFMESCNLDLLKYGTTRVEDRTSDKEFYSYSTESEFKSINENDLVEFRSYYTIDQGVVYYYTTKSTLIKSDKNLTCIASPYQYENYRKWCTNQNILNANNRSDRKYKLYAIMIDATITNRIQYLMKEYCGVTNEDIIYDVCRRLISERNEYNDVYGRIPDLAHPFVSPNVCYIDDNEYKKDYFLNNLNDIKNFIKKNVRKEG